MIRVSSIWLIMNGGWDDCDREKRSRILIDEYLTNSIANQEMAKALFHGALHLLNSYVYESIRQVVITGNITSSIHMYIHV